MLILISSPLEYRKTYRVEKPVFEDNENCLNPIVVTDGGVNRLTSERPTMSLAFVQEETMNWMTNRPE